MLPKSDMYDCRHSDLASLSIIVTCSVENFAKSHTVAYRVSIATISVPLR